MLAFTGFAQQQTYDLLTFTPPSGWNKTSLENTIGFSTTDNIKRTWAQISIVKSTVSKGSIESDFQSEWKDLAVTPYAVGEQPIEIDKQMINGWSLWTGLGQFTFNNETANLLLSTFSDGQQCMSFIMMSNTTDYGSILDQFLASILLPAAKSNIDKPVMQLTSNEDIITSTKTVVGTWIKKSGSHPEYANTASWGTSGSSTDEYRFHPDNTYEFYSKFFTYVASDLLLVRESGNYTVSGNQVTLNPKKSVIESWSKKNGTDKWGTLVKSQDRKLETITYTFTKHYFSGIQQWSLVLMAATPTARDGAFSNNKSFENAYYYSPPSSSNTPVELPETPSENVTTSAPAADGFTFNTTTFEDGWTSVVKEDWVEANKGNIKVIIHYPRKEDAEYISQQVDRTKRFWDLLIAPRYTNASDFFIYNYNMSSEPAYFASAYLIDNGGNKQFVALFSKGKSGWIEVITPDKNTFIKNFRVDQPDSYFSEWETLSNLSGLNHFAVAESDLTGKWSSDFSGSLQYYSAFTGLYAGYNAYSSRQTFNFNNNRSYDWKLSTANSSNGQTVAETTQSSGTFSMKGNWQMVCSKIQKGPKTYNVYFSCIKGGRILWMQDVEYGDYTPYGKSAK
jgi:hypothetical protein